MRGIKNCDGTGGQVVELEQDMVTIKSEPKMLIPGYKNSRGTGFEGHEMYEFSSIRKFNDRYYFIYSSRLSHELEYAVSDRPDGGFKFGGALISNGDIGYAGLTEKQALYYWGNIHGSIECINGKYYVFYHRQTNKNEQTRQGCAQEIKIEADGRIKQVEMTSCGLNGGALKGKGIYPAYIACNLFSKEGAVKCAYGPFSRSKYSSHPYIGEYKNGKQCIRKMSDGATAGFKYFDIDDHTRVSVTVKGAGGIIEIKTNLHERPIGIIKTESSSHWSKFSADSALRKGKTALYFIYRGVGKIDLLNFELSDD